MTGLEHTNKNAVLRELVNREGELYDQDKWIIEKNAFTSLGIFSDVSLDLNTTENGLDLTYAFKELPPYIPFLGFKITDQNGFMAGPAFAFLNLFGEAVRLELFYRVTIYPEFYRASEYLAYLSSQWVYDIPLEYTIFAVYYDLYNPLKLFDERSVAFNINCAYRIKKFKILFSGEIYRVLHDYDNEYFNASDRTSRIFLSDASSEYVPMLGTGIAHDTRDRRIDTRNGIYQEVRVSFYGGELGGPARYTEYLYDFRGYKTFFHDHILHLSTLGQYRPGSMGAYDFFHVGGPNTLRGYDQDPDNYGQHELLATLEYRFDLLKQRHFTLSGLNLFIALQLVAGTDTAVLWTRDDRLRDGRRLHSFYTGVHILFPGFQRMRLEYGLYRNNDRNINFGFTMGFYEKSKVQRWIIR